MELPKIKLEQLELERTNTLSSSKSQNINNLHFTNTPLH